MNSGGLYGLPLFVYANMYDFKANLSIFVTHTGLPLIITWKKTMYKG